MWAFPGLILCPRYNWLSTVESVRASEPSCRDSNPGVPDNLLSMLPRFINSPAAYNISEQQRLNNVDQTHLVLVSGKASTTKKS